MNLLSGKAFRIAVEHGNRGAGQTNLNGNSFDCQGHRSLAAVVEWGTIVANAATSLHWQGSDDGTNWEDLEGTNVDVPANADNLLSVIGLERPLHRYNRLVVSRGTANATLRTALYIAGFSRDSDIEQDADVDDLIWFTSPQPGTP